MKMLIEFYRIRDVDDAHAVLGRESVEAGGVDEAIEAARELLRTLDMPQRPDAMTIADVDGNELHSSRLDTVENPDERPPP